MLPLLLLLALDGPALAPGAAMPSGDDAWTDYPWGPDFDACRTQDPWLLCGGATVELAARRHAQPVVSEHMTWLRVAGLEFQRFAVEPLADGAVRLGHPNAPHDGWEVWGLPSGPPASQERARVELTGDGVRGLVGAAERMRACQGVQVDGFPLQLLFDDQGAVRMLRLQAVPDAGLDAVAPFACVARALDDVRPMPGVTSAELQISRALE